MHRIRSFRIRHKHVKVAGAVSRLRGFARSLKKCAKNICFWKFGSSYIRLGRKEKNQVPKGHLAVYVGEKEDHARRVLVPVISFNHPLFGDLLRETEKVYGFNYDGGIHVPCRISEFENLQTRINGCRRFRARRS